MPSKTSLLCTCHEQPNSHGTKFGTTLFGHVEYLINSNHQFQDASNCHCQVISTSYDFQQIPEKMYEAQQKNDQIRRFSKSPGSTEDRDCCKNFCESFIPVNSLVKLAMASCKLRHSKLFCCFQPRCEKQLFSLFKNQHHEK